MTDGCDQILLFRDMKIKRNEREIIWYQTVTVTALYKEFLTLNVRSKVLPFATIFGHYRYF
jgi:hypothetical protein